MMFLLPQMAVLRLLESSGAGRGSARFSLCELERLFIGNRGMLPNAAADDQAKLLNCHQNDNER
jgi:hypothetical protein